MPPVLLVGGGELAGGDDCGCVGVLALGQPDSIRHTQLANARCRSGRHPALLKIERFDKFLCLQRVAGLKPGSEGRVPQSLH